LKVTVERTPESEAVLNIELEWSELEKASDKAYRKLVQKYNVPGFRRGHAPRTMLERMLGKDALYQEGLDDLIDQSINSAVREHSLRPLARPSVDTPPIEHGQPYAFVARLPVLTPVVLGDYQSIRVEQPTVEVTDEDVQKVLGDIQLDQAMWLPADRPAQLDDKVVVDLKVTAGDRTISDLHDNEFTLADERPGIFAGMDARIVGMKEGETKEFTTTIPEDYANTELAGKEASFTVTVKGVKYRELPALDDELAKSLGEFQTMDDVRKAIHDQLLTRKQEQAQRELRDEVAKAAAEQATVEIHEVLVDEEVHSMMHEMERTLKQQSRLSLQQYLSVTNKTEEQLHTDLEPEAKERVRRDLVLSAVADAEHLDATDDEIEGWLAVLSAVSGGKPIRPRDLSANQRANVISRIRRDKAWDHLVEIAISGAPAETPVKTANGGKAEPGKAESGKAEAAQSERGAKATAQPAGAAPTESVSDAAPEPKATAKAGAKTAGGTEARAEGKAEPAAQAESAGAKRATGGAPKKQAQNTEVPESDQ
jgi:trigger factor